MKFIFQNRKSQIANRKCDGIALVLTLILLAVTLVMAVAFLFISRREQGSVATQTDAATARYAADAALAKAEAQVTANILSSGQPNPYNLGLLVSTNYINPFGFAPGLTNVNYDYDTTGAALSPAEFLENLTNLFYDPRPPVFIPTNGNAGGYDFRFYLDLNRNGVYDTNGITGDFNPGGFTGQASPKVGDPEWIGVLEHPDQPYGPNNHFVARYAFIAVPVGDALDLNAIHNQVLDENNGLNSSVDPPPSGNDAFFRNQGAGSWEINLAAFLADLNTNQWGLVIGNAANGNTAFYYYQYPSGGNPGFAFNDARVLLAYRYANNYNSLASVQNLFGANGATAFQNDNIDGYGDGPLQTTTAGLNESVIANQDIPSLPWAGANNTNHFFDLPSELFNSADSSAGFVQRLANASAGADSYDRYTFYRLLSELGTDSDPESGRVNLNYDNLDAFGNVIPNAETNFISWTPLGFFTNAADRMLREYTAEWATIYATNLNTGFVTNGINTNFIATFNITNAFGVTNIPVWVSNRFVYTPAVQRVLQLAANLYDATTNNSVSGSPDWPDAFRPLFSSDINGNVFITGYTNVTAMADPTTDPQMLLPVDVSTISGINVLANVYGVPWIIGAKKGYPNFNAFSMQSVFQITRKLQYTRSSTNMNYLFSPNSYTLSQQLTLALTNSVGVEFWNSYSNNFLANNLQIWVYDTNYLAATNDEGAVYNNGMSAGMITNLTLWPGAGLISLGQLNPHSFIVPLNTNFMALPMSAYQFGNLLQPFTTNLANAGPNPTFYTNYLQPQWTLLTTNRLRVVVLDEDTTGNYHVLDYVQLSGPDATLTNQFVTGNATGYGQPQWEVNSNAQGIPLGFNNQIGVALDSPRYFPNHISDWDNQDSTTVENEIDGFRAFMYGPNSLIYRNPGESNVVAAAVSTNMQVPYTPSQWIVMNTAWEANDPLVHYTASDLTDLSASSDAQYIYNYGEFQGEQPPIPFGTLNKRYMPWGRGLSVAGTDSNPFNLAFKDSLMWQSDNWDFPTAKLPTAGWIGRVHRGTPWQTVYLKSTNIMNLNFKDAKGNTISGPTTWIYWTGNGIANDQFNNAPVEDRLLFDLFTAKFNDNAARGQLSVNIGASTGAHNIAAWSALFSGVQVLSNNLPDSIIYLAPQISYTASPISPAGPYDSTLPSVQQPPLAQLAAAIDQTRANFKNRDGLTGAFEHTGDILATPQFSDQSPFLNLLTTNGTPDSVQQTNGISDEMYEWLPQQTMSLLRLGSARYVVYCYGQTLKPAPNGIYLGAGNYFGMVTNYQVTAEAATRAVVRFTPTNAVIENFNVLPPD